MADVLSFNGFVPASLKKEDSPFPFDYKEFKDRAINVKWFGAKGDGVTDDTAAINALITEIGSNKYSIYFPSGIYKISSNITIPSNIKIIFDNEAKISLQMGIAFTINGAIEAGLYQIFDVVSGIVDLRNALITCAYPEWFGAENNGNADKTTKAFKDMFASKPARVCGAQNATYIINETIIVNPIEENYWATSGRIIDFSRCILKATDKSGVKPDFLFKFISQEWPKNLRNTQIRNFIFDGEVNDSFIYFENSFSWYNTIEYISSTNAAKAISLIKIVNTSHTGQGGINTFRNIQSHQNIKRTITFHVESGALSEFDDLIIERIAGGYRNTLDDTDNSGAVIYLNPNAYIITSKIQSLIFGGQGHVIGCAFNNNYILYSIIHNIYSEPVQTSNTFAIACNLVRCSVNNIRIFLGDNVPSYVRCFYGSAKWCNISNFLIDKTGGVIFDTPHYEEAGPSQGNILDHIGNNPSTHIIQIAGNISNIILDRLLSGTTANRPSANIPIGYIYFDTTKGKPIWYNGTNWVDATGAVV